MAEGAREQILSFIAITFAVKVCRLDHYFVGTAGDAPFTGEREATLALVLFSFGLYYNRIDENDGRVFFYLYNDGKLTKIDATYDDDEDVEAWVWTAIAEGTIIVTDVEIVLADEATKNPDTGANDVVGVAAALAVVSLVAAGAVSLKK